MTSSVYNTAESTTIPGASGLSFFPGKNLAGQSFDARKRDGRPSSTSACPPGYAPASNVDPVIGRFRGRDGPVESDGDPAFVESSTERRLRELLEDYNHINRSRTADHSTQTNFPSSSSHVMPSPISERTDLPIPCIKGLPAGIEENQDWPPALGPFRSHFADQNAALEYLKNDQEQHYPKGSGKEGIPRTPEDMRPYVRLIYHALVASKAYPIPGEMKALFAALTCSYERLEAWAWKITVMVADLHRHGLRVSKSPFPPENSPRGMDENLSFVERIMKIAMLLMVYKHFTIRVLQGIDLDDLIHRPASLYQEKSDQQQLSRLQPAQPQRTRPVAQTAAHNQQQQGFPNPQAMSQNQQYHQNRAPRPAVVNRQLESPVHGPSIPPGRQVQRAPSTTMPAAPMPWQLGPVPSYLTTNYPTQTHLGNFNGSSAMPTAFMGSQWRLQTQVYPNQISASNAAMYSLPQQVRYPMNHAHLSSNIPYTQSSLPPRNQQPTTISPEYYANIQRQQSGSPAMQEGNSYHGLQPYNEIGRPQQMGRTPSIASTQSPQASIEGMSPQLHTASPAFRKRSFDEDDATYPDEKRARRGS